MVTSSSFVQQVVYPTLTNDTIVQQCCVGRLSEGDKYLQVVIVRGQAEREDTMKTNHKSKNAHLAVGAATKHNYKANRCSIYGRRVCLVDFLLAYFLVCPCDGVHKYIRICKPSKCTTGVKGVPEG
jgi:hypothetical protein